MSAADKQAWEFFNQQMNELDRRSNALDKVTLAPRDYNMPFVPSQDHTTFIQDGAVSPALQAAFHVVEEREAIQVYLVDGGDPPADSGLWEGGLWESIKKDLAALGPMP
jgi:hypothetical protein